jgi:hypothetical protein
MNARDDLHDRMHGVGYCNPPCGLCVEVADLLDAYAHELAEKQRAKARQYAILRSEEMRLRAEGLREGADLIDPEAP